MATYVNDLRLKEIATGDEAGTWGTSTNTNLELIAEAFSFGTEAITTNADTHTTTIADGSTDPGRSIYLKYTGTLDSACTITIGPNTVSKLWFIENGTSGSQNIIISQGSGANVTVPAGEVKAIYSDGAGSGAAMVDAFAGLKVSDAAQTNITSLGTLTTLTVDDITINGSTISDSGDLTLDIGGDIILDADDNEIQFKDGGTHYGKIYGSSSNFYINSVVQDKDIIFVGDDGGSSVTALTLDMSDAGKALFNKGATFNELVTIDGGSTANTVLALDSSTANTFLKITDSNTNEGNFIGCTTDDLTFFTRNAERVRIDSTGRVGIGASPSSPLTVSAADGTLANFTNASNADFQFKTASAVALITPSTGTLAFGTSDTERMRIASDGKVGIGVTDADELLTVGGDMKIKSTNKLHFTNTSDQVFIHAPASNTLALSTNNTERIRMTSTGAIGMGTTPPSDTHTGWTQLFIGQKGSVISENATGVHGLDGTFVTDNMYVDSDTGAFAYIEANESSAYRQEAGIHQFFTQASGSAGAAVTLSEKMRIASDGKVGIGESAPSNAKLEILQAGDHDAHSTHGIAIHSTGNTNFTSMYMGVEDGIDSAYIQSVALDGSFTSKSLLLNANGGKVGIGINAPTKTLQIESGSTADDGLFLSHSSGTVYAKLSVNNPGTDNDTLFGSVTNNGVRLLTNNAEKARLSADGYFFVGQTSRTASVTNGGVYIAGDVNVGSTNYYAQVYVQHNSAVNHGIVIDEKATGGSGVAMGFLSGGTVVGTITVTSSATTYNTSSDARLKDVTGKARGLEVINKLNPVAYNWKDSGQADEGLIAQEVMEIVPNAVSGSEEDYYQMDYSKLVTPLIKAIQEQQEQIDALQSEINLLKGE